MGPNPPASKSMVFATTACSLRKSIGSHNTQDMAYAITKNETN
jgi:hypothetical protein